MQPMRLVLVIGILNSAFLGPALAGGKLPGKSATGAAPATISARRGAASAQTSLGAGRPAARIKDAKTAAEKEAPAQRRESASLPFGMDLFFSMFKSLDLGSSSRSWGPSPGEKGASRSWGEGHVEKVVAAPYTKLAAQPRAQIERLLKQEGRPSIAQMMKAVRAAYGGELPTENPFGGTDQVAQAKKTVVDTVVQLERAYPGATFYAVGRDAALIGDALDAFYSAIGQPDRVRRLDISHPSFPNYHGSVTEKTAREDRPLLNDFLKSGGIDVEKLDGQPMHVMIDATPYANASQSRQLMRAAFQSAKIAGLDPRKVYDRVAFVGLPMGTPDFSLSSSLTELRSDQARLREATSAEGPPKIFYLTSGIDRLSYTGFWHEMFEKLVPDGKGGVVARIGEAERPSERARAAAQLYEVGRLMSSPDFVSSVKEAAEARYGFVFPMKRTEKLRVTDASMSVERPRASRWDVEDERPRASARSSSFMVALKRDLADPKTDKPKIARDFLKDMAGMWIKGTATKHDVREAVRALSVKVDLEQRGLQQKLERDVYAHYPGFEKVVLSASRKP